MSEFARELAALAGEIAEVIGDELRLRRPSDLAFRQKDNAEGEVTEFDEWAEREIARLIRNCRPRDGMLGEESVNRPSASGVVWKVDPIDGSVNFIRGIPGWTVVISAELEGVPLAAAVYDPMTVGADGKAGEVFLTDGQTVKVNDVNASLNGRAVLDGEAVVGIGYEHDPEIRALQGTTFAQWFPNVRDIRRAGSSVREAVYVAVGRADAFYGFLYPYESSAVRVFASAAGATLSFEDVQSVRHPGMHRVILTATSEFHAVFSESIKDSERAGGLVVGDHLVL